MSKDFFVCTSITQSGAGFIRKRPALDVKDFTAEVH